MKAWAMKADASIIIKNKIPGKPMLTASVWLIKVYTFCCIIAADWLSIFFLAILVAETHIKCQNDNSKFFGDFYSCFSCIIVYVIRNAAFFAGRLVPIKHEQTELLISLAL